MENRSIENDAFNYMMQPGDGTMYRFTIQFMPIVEKYVLDGAESSNCIWLAINMPAGTGVGIIGKSQLKYFADGNNDNLVDHLRSNGFKGVNDFTLVAVLFAASILAIDPENVDVAAAEMLKAREFLMKLYSS